MAPKRKPFKATVKGIDWEMHLQTPAAYRKMHGKDSAAIIYPGDKETFFNSDYFEPMYIRHEVLHIYVASTSTSSMVKDADDAEELSAQIFGEHALEMLLLVDKILEHFLK